MKTQKENQKNTNAVKEVYNLIVLDRSGSMSSIRSKAIAGVNETVGTIRAAGRANDLKQYVTITTFCGCSTTDFCTNTPVDDVPVMTAKDYQPCCSTPLYDTLGSSLIAMRERLKGRTDVAVSVTIITDGYENASRRYSYEKMERSRHQRAHQAPHRRRLALCLHRSQSGRHYRVGQSLDQKCDGL